MGVVLSEDEENGRIRGYWPERSLLIRAESVADVMQEMQAAQALAARFKLVATAGNEKFAVVNEQDDVLKGSPMLLSEAHSMIHGGKDTWERSDPLEDLGEDVNLKELMPNGKVPEDGAEAYHQGYKAADCPFNSETEDDEEYARFEEWNAAWDEAADEAEEEPTGSVVKPEYRARYAEMGHPTHCGDWLAEFLNDMCIPGESKETDLVRFEAICNANGVSLAKYNRTSNGWQGRLRMTGRNLLKSVVVRAGFILVPNMDGLLDKYEADPEWVAAKAPKKGNHEKADSSTEGAEA
jgi:hypothetical protein